MNSFIKREYFKGVIPVLCAGCLHIIYKYVTIDKNQVKSKYIHDNDH
jgi:septum formation topological specificity factor MinE